jgi:hypothetical protein
MAVQKNFVVRNGLEVNNNLLVADSSTDHVGVGTSSPKYTLEVIGGIGVTYVDVLGIGTVVQEFNVGTGGTVITSLNTGLTGFGTQSPTYIVDIRSPVSTGQTALYVQGDVRVTGDLYADDISFDQATLNNLEVTGVGTIATASIELGYVNTGIVTNLITSGIGTIETASINLGYVNTGIVTNLITSGIGSITIAAIRDGYINTGIVTNLVTTGIASIATGVVTDAYVTTGIVTNLVTSGIGSITTAAIDTGYINTGIVTNLVTTGIASISVGVVTDAYVTTGIVTNLVTSGIGSITTAAIDTGYVTTGIITNLTTTGIASIATGVVTDAYITTGVATNFSVSGIGSITTAAIDTGYVTTGIVTNLTTTGIASIATGVITDAYVTTGIVTTLTGTTLDYSGIGTIATFSSTDATITTIDATNVTVTGIVTANEYTINGTTVVNSSRELQNIASLDATTTATIEAAIANAPNTSQDIVVTGIASINTGVFTSLYSPIGIITTLSGANINYSGIGSFGSVNADTGRINTGIVTNLTVSGIATFQGDVKLGDNDKLYFGDGNDLEIFHDGSDSYIRDVGTGDLKVIGVNLTLNSDTVNINNAANTETLIRAFNNGAVNLYYDNVLKFETTEYGVNVSGVLQSQGLNSSGIGTISVNSSSDALRITQTGSGNALVVEDSANPDSTPFVVSANGNVGIGTDIPGVPLHVFGNARIRVGTDQVFSVVSTGGITQLQGINEAANAFEPLDIAGSDIRLSPGSVEAVRINSSGNIGIGTNSPATNFKLDVNGDLSLGEFGGTDNTYIDQKQDGGLDIINSGRNSNDGRIRINYTNSISGDTTYFRDFLVYGGKQNILIAADGSSGFVGISSEIPSTTLDVGGTASIKVPVGTTAERPGSPITGFVRFNTDLNTFEGYNGSEWGGLGGAAEKDTAVATTSATTCESFAIASYRSATITAQITQGSNYQVGKYLVIHDGTTASLIEESAIATGSMLGSFTATISGGNLLFQVNMSSSSSATVTTLMTKVSV